MNHERLAGNRRAHERRVSRRRAVDGGFSVASDAAMLWRSSAEILGFGVQAADGALGRVEDFCVEEECSVITAIIVSARHRLSGQRRLFVPLSAIERIDWQGRKVYLRPARAEVRRWSWAACPPSQHAARA